jgi:hypothetical protein
MLNIVSYLVPADVDMWTAINDVAGNLYVKVEGSITILFALFLLITFLIKGASNNDKTVSMITAWQKRIGWCFAGAMCVGAIVAYVVPLLTPYQYHPTTSFISPFYSSLTAISSMLF